MLQMTILSPKPFSTHSANNVCQLPITITITHWAVLNSNGQTSLLAMLLYYSFCTDLHDVVYFSCRSLYEPVAASTQSPRHPSMDCWLGSFISRSSSDAASRTVMSLKVGLEWRSGCLRRKSTTQENGHMPLPVSHIPTWNHQFVDGTWASGWWR